MYSSFEKKNCAGHAVPVKPPKFSRLVFSVVVCLTLQKLPAIRSPVRTPAARIRAGSAPPSREDIIDRHFNNHDPLQMKTTPASPAVAFLRILVASLAIASAQAAPSAPSVITGISPNNIQAEGGTALTITGHGLSSATSATVGGVEVFDLQVIDDHTIVATTSADMNAAVSEVSVTTAQGTTSVAGLLNMDPIQQGESIPAAATYWKGQTSSLWNATNWASDSNGTATTARPTNADAITFSATGAGNRTTTLGTDFTIKSLTISDTNAVTIGGSNKLTLTDTNAITVNSGAGLLTLSSTGLVLSGASPTIAVNNAAGALISSNLDTNTSLLAKTGTGTLTLTGTNTYTGDTGINGGTLQVSGGGAITQTSGLTLDFYSSTVSNVLIDGSGKGGSITATGSTIVAWSGTSTLTLQNGGTLSDALARVGWAEGSNGTANVDGKGSTWTNSNDLIVGGNGPASNLGGSVGVVNITNDGLISDRLANIGDQAGATGTVTVDGKGSTWTNTNPYGLPLLLGNSGSGTLNIQNSGTVTNNDANTKGAFLGVMLAQSDGSTGNLNIKSGGTLFSSTGIVGQGSGATGTVTVDGAGSAWTMTGNLTVDNGGTGSVTITHGGLVTNQAAILAASTKDLGTVTVDGAGAAASATKWTNSGDVIVGQSGPGVLNIKNGGQVDVNSTLSQITLGQNTGSSGTLNIGSGGTSGILNAGLVTGGDGTASINFNHTDAAYNFTPVIAGSTSVNQTGSGSTVLTNDSTYTGTTNVTAGALIVDGSLDGGANITVGPGATLAGTGGIFTAGDQSIFINGTLNVGDPSIVTASTLTLDTFGKGAVVMGAGSFIHVNLFTGAGLGDNTATSSAADILSLHGLLNATAGGTLILGNPNHMTTFALGDHWQVLDLNSSMKNSGTVSGTLAVNVSALGLSNGLSGSFDPSSGIFSIVNNTAQISATTTGLPMANVEGQVLISGSQTVTGDVNNHLYNLRAGDGEEAANDGIAAAMDEGVVVGQGDGDPDSKSPIAKRVLRSRQWEVFATVNYGNLNLRPISSQAGVQVDSWASSVGIQRHITRGLAVGFATTYLTSDQNYTSGLGHVHLEGPALSAYLSFVRKDFWSSLLYSFGTYDMNTNRNPGLGFAGALGSTHTNTNAIQYNTGWNFRFQNNTLVTGPFAGIDYLVGTVAGYSETGGGGAALSYGRQTYQSLVTRVGWSLSKKLTTNWARITPQVRLSYERQNLTNNGTSVSLINAPFTATGGNQSPGQSYMVAGGGVNFQFTDRISLLLSYQGQFFRNNLQAHFGSVRLSYQF